MFDPRVVLSVPQLYQGFQVVGGWFGARIRAISKYVELREGSRIVDIGCGPGYLYDHLPSSCEYIGYDTDASYIEHAKSRGQRNAQYFCARFDSSAARDVAPVDVIMMNGLLHHLTDEEARQLLLDCLAALRPRGKVFSLDGCYVSEQTLLRRKMLDWDRGQFVRSRGGYESLFPTPGFSLESHVDENISWFPYTFASIVAIKEADQSFS